MEISFRAWDDVNKDMIDIARFDFADYTVYSHLFACEGYLGENLRIMQYTGLKDKNGKEIYEGDAVEGVHRHFEWKQKEKVFFLNGCFMIGNWNAHEFFNRFQHINVIGNIYENPELLEAD